MNDKCIPRRNPCKHLHICRDFDRCEKEACPYPHNLSEGHNRKILQDTKCASVDPILLIRILKLAQFQTQSKKKRNRVNETRAQLQDRLNSWSISNDLDRSPSITGRHEVIEIKLQRGWAMVSNHPHFGIEYKTYLSK